MMLLDRLNTCQKIVSAVLSNKPENLKLLSNIFTETAREVFEAYRVVVASKGIEEEAFQKNLSVFAAADNAIKAAIADARTKVDVPPP